MCAGWCVEFLFIQFVFVCFVFSILWSLVIFLTELNNLTYPGDLGSRVTYDNNNIIPILNTDNFESFADPHSILNPIHTDATLHNHTTPNAINKKTSSASDVHMLSRTNTETSSATDQTPVRSYTPQMSGSAGTDSGIVLDLKSSSSLRPPSSGSTKPSKGAAWFLRQLVALLHIFNVSRIFFFSCSFFYFVVNNSWFHYWFVDQLPLLGNISFSNLATVLGVVQS